MANYFYDGASEVTIELFGDRCTAMLRVLMQPYAQGRPDLGKFFNNFGHLIYT